MARRKKTVRKLAKTDRLLLIEKALKKYKKADLVGVIVPVAKANRVFARTLESELDVEKPVDLLIADAKSAIAQATDFDDGCIDDHFDYNCEAYEEIKALFRALIALGHLQDVKELALQLMDEGSYQVQCSAEGLMQDDIEECLAPVIRAVKAEGGQAAGKWAVEMRRADRLDFICEDDLKRMLGKG